jgi:hypothetical protein
MTSKVMVRVGLLGLIACSSATAYLWWQYHLTNQEELKPLVFMGLCASTAWTLGLIIWNTVQEDEERNR